MHFRNRKSRNKMIYDGEYFWMLTIAISLYQIETLRDLVRAWINWTRRDKLSPRRFCSCCREDSAFNLLLPPLLSKQESAISEPTWISGCSIVLPSLGWIIVANSSPSPQIIRWLPFCKVMDVSRVLRSHHEDVEFSVSITVFGLLSLGLPMRTAN